MTEIGVLAMRALAGGTLVVVFALVGEVLSPKAFSGLFSAAPSVAVASLTITVLSETTEKARLGSVGMVVGAVGLTTCCVLGAVAIPRLKALRGSLLAVLGWAAVTFGVYWAVFIGAQ